ncbi:MAG TPA: hypothetical protein VFX45_06605 [Solirubrobacterales bacterium]|nr:hypothetical protein [Solirubrobacterales bacterium]
MQRLGETRRYLVLPMALAIVLGVTAIALAAKPNKNPVVVEVGDMRFTADGGFSPEALPKSKPAPITFFLSGKVESKSGEHPPALRTFELEGDKHVSIDVAGIPVCKAGQLQSTTTAAAKAVCGKTLVGQGKTTAEIKFPEQPPIPVKSPLLVLNGGTRGGVTTLFVHAYITVPTPAAIVTTVKIKKIHKGRFGLGSVATIPKIAGGSGSVTSFELTLNRGILSATCPDGHLNARGAAIFEGGLKVSAEVARPCRPKG